MPKPKKKREDVNQVARRVTAVATKTRSETPAQQVSRLVDTLGSPGLMSKQGWIEFLEEVISDCEFKAEVALDELRRGHVRRVGELQGRALRPRCQKRLGHLYRDDAPDRFLVMRILGRAYGVIGFTDGPV